MKPIRNSLLKIASPAQKIAFSFLIVILCGTLLLMLPLSTTPMHQLSFVDALFTATSATCVTGLSTVVVSETFTLFGQWVILLLIQIGGLGFLTFMSLVISFTRNKFSMREKKAMKEMLNQDNIVDMKSFIQNIVKYTFFFELIGTICIGMVIIPKFDFFDGLFKSLFLSVSAFCNAGFDPLGANSLQEYANEPFLLIVIMTLVVIGGIGFAVWFDLRDKIIPFIKRKLSFRRFRQSLTFHTKVVLVITALMICGGALMIMISEWNNPLTLGMHSYPMRILLSFFESIALRTAGFTSIAYSGAHSATCMVMFVLMFIGGSPGGTAGGIKTTTIAVILLYVLRMFQGKNKTVLWKRTVSKSIIVRAMAVFFLNLTVLLIGIYLLCIVEPFNFLDIGFEAVSALATVGSSRGITPLLSSAGKAIIIVMMYVGRIGIMTLVVSLIKKGSQNDASITYPEANIIV